MRKSAGGGRGIRAMGINAKEFVGNLFNLTGRVGIVTGASRGIGAGIATVVSSAGATLHNFDIRDPEEAVDNVITHKVDLTDATALEKAVAAVAGGEGRLDFLVNNAGITHKQRAEEFDMDRYRTIQQLNLESLFLLCRQCYPHLKKSPHIGRIVTISSMAAHMGFTGVVPYCMTKSGVLGLTRGLAVEWAKDNILVNSVAPGWLLTKLNEDMFAENPDRREAASKMFVLGRFGVPADVGNMILFLLGGASTYLTGQDFAVDGGALAHGF